MTNYIKKLMRLPRDFILTGHLKEHRKDTHSRKGLLSMVGKRRRLLNYIKTKNPEKYQEVMLKTQL